MRNVKLCAMLTALVVATFVAPAAATPPERSPVDATNVLSAVPGICPFPVDIVQDLTGSATTFFDANGNLTQFHLHLTEQDVFSANGRSLTSLPYTYNLRLVFDPETGELEKFFLSGVILRVPLPSGEIFHSAGRVDLLGPGPSFVITPDVGRSGDVGAFCGAQAG
jgi:hypothetical protein